ncbi:auxin efflux carrier component 2-like [Senna tora]|uniref:Auxin efflux carrier component n=1 Tax=Senna tora TaxID=362788 RepID=A0A834TJZ1_9FABA|nr:auxin efflux carrier component 2-like [Senna tora]
MILDLGAIFGAVVPLYFAIMLAFLSVRWWKVFTPEQCSGINKFVGDFAVPFLVLDLLTANDPYTMNFHVLAADALQKLVILAPLLVWKSLSKNGSFDWVITLIALSTISNTLLVGLPLVQSMYGHTSSDLLIQLVVLQSLVWFNVLLGMYEYRAARILIAQKFPNTAASIVSVRINPHVASLSDTEQLETDTEIDADGKLHVVLRTLSTSSTISVDSMYSAQSTIELRSSLKRAGSSSTSRSYGTPEGRYHKQGSNSSRVADASFDIEAITEVSEPSIQTGTDSKNLDEGRKENPPAGVVARLIIITVWRKLIRNPNTYASVVGITWSLIAFRYNIKLPLILKGSITIISKTGVGLAMFSLGLFIALQPNIISCKISTVVKCIAVRLIVGPAVMAATSAAVGLHGIVFKTATIQAALPLSIVCFVFAKQYDVHPHIFSTTIITTTALFLPATIVYYLLFRLLP